MKTIIELRQSIETRRTRSAWERAVATYSLELLGILESDRKINNLDFSINPLEIEQKLLNGAFDWNQYSWGGCSLIYDTDIAERVCTPSELKKTRNGERRPNGREQWLDVQARALCQAAMLIVRLAEV